MRQLAAVNIALLVVLAAGCAGSPRDGAIAPPLDATRKVSEQDCTRPLDDDGGNLLCRRITEEERRAMAEEEARLARARKEAAERAERERLERERAEQRAREEAARKAREAELERLAAERRRLEAEAARKAQEERERREKAEAEARARREAAERACRELEQQRHYGRVLLEDFIASYGDIDEFQEIAPQIRAFLAKPRKVKPCPPA